MNEEIARDCGACGARVVRGEPDPCLGRLPGVTAACCGHGELDGHVLFDDGTNLRFPTCSVTRWPAGEVRKP